jgi:hypothetical protein
MQDVRKTTVFGLTYYLKNPNLPAALVPNHLEAGPITSTDELRHRAQLAVQYLGPDSDLAQDAWARLRLVESNAASLGEVVFTEQNVCWTKLKAVYSSSKVRKARTDTALIRSKGGNTQSAPSSTDTSSPNPPAASSSGPMELMLHENQITPAFQIYKVQNGPTIKGLALPIDRLEQAKKTGHGFDEVYDFACRELESSSCQAIMSNGWLCFKPRV